MDASGLARRIRVRHRESGYLRLEMPAELCAPAVAARIEAGMLACDGVYRASFHPGQRRLVLRHDPYVIDAPGLAAALKRLLGGMPADPAAPAAPGMPRAAAIPAPATLTDARRRAEQAFAGLRAQLERWRGSTAGGATRTLGARLKPVVAGALSERAVINFLNDLIAFYLVKAHWELITQRWLKAPLRHADAWLATFYLVFLLVRYRRSLMKGAASTAGAAPIKPSA